MKWTIPAGWREVLADERIVNGDKVSFNSGMNYEPCAGLIGHLRDDYPTVPIIRLGMEPPKTKPEPEWVNPWD